MVTLFILICREIRTSNLAIIKRIFRQINWIWKRNSRNVEVNTREEWLCKLSFFQKQRSNDLKRGMPNSKSTFWTLKANWLTLRPDVATRMAGLGTWSWNVKDLTKSGKTLLPLWVRERSPPSHSKKTKKSAISPTVALTTTTRSLHWGEWTHIRHSPEPADRAIRLWTHPA